MNEETQGQTENLPALPPAKRAAVVLKSEAVAKELSDLVESTQSITEITNADGRAECHAAAMRAKAARIAIEKASKEARDDANAFSKAVIAEEKRLTAIVEPEQNRLLALRDAWDAKVEAEKEAKRKEEAEKAAAIARKIDAIRNIVVQQAGKTSEEIRAALRYVKEIEIDDSYGAQFGAAKEARGDVILKLVEMIDAAEQREAEIERAAEEKRLADEKAERERIEREAAEKRQREEDERIRAENERVRAENEAAAKKLREEREEFERQRIAAEEKARAEKTASVSTIPAAAAAPIARAFAQTSEVARAASVTTVIEPAAKAIQAPPINLGEINRRLGFTVSAGFLADLGIEPCATDKRAVLYDDFDAICTALIDHIGAIRIASINKTQEKAA